MDTHDVVETVALQFPSDVITFPPPVDFYEVMLLVAGVAIFGAAALPRILENKPMSFPLIYLALGFTIFSLPIGVEVPNPIDNPGVAEHFTELVVIISMMGAGLKLDRPFDWQGWASTWRLLGIAMPLTIAAIALLGWGLLGLHPATAVLLGAVLAPTDPVLASSVEASPPGAYTDTDMDPEEQEGAIRFALTSEAGLNDGLAFPFTYLAIVMAAAPLSSPGDWLVSWFGFYVVYKIAVGVVGGVVVGYLIARFIFGQTWSTDLGRVMEGTEALAATLFAYAATELVQGYGFLAVFVAALVLRHYEWEHDYYEKLHDFGVVLETLLMAAVMVLFGGVIANGLLGPLTLWHVFIGLTAIFLVRPLAGYLATLGSGQLAEERMLISFYGIRGVGSFYYLSYALSDASFQELELVIAADDLWAIVGFTVVASLFVHGISAGPVMSLADRWRRRYKEDFVPPEEVD